jgi:hypothetical protein
MQRFGPELEWRWDRWGDPPPQLISSLELAWYKGVAPEAYGGSRPADGRQSLLQRLVRILVFVSVTSSAVLAGRAISPPIVIKTAANNPAAVRAPWRQQGVKLASNATWQGKPMSSWRRAYIMKHGRQPGVPAASRHSSLRVRLGSGPTTWLGKPMSSWRRGYIAKHGHQPPAG